MAKYFGFSAGTQNLRFIRAGTDTIHLADSATHTVTALVTARILSANISGADMVITSAANGGILTIAAKNSQVVEKSGTATHLYLDSGFDTFRINVVMDICAQILTSGSTININAWAITALTSAIN